MSKSTEYVSFTRNYIHTRPWRHLPASAFRTGHCLLCHVDHYGLVAIDPEERLRFILEQQHMRVSHLQRDIDELQEANIIFLYCHNKHGRIIGFPDYVHTNQKKYPKPSLYTPFPFDIEMRFPEYAAVIARYEGKQQEQQTTGPGIAQAIALWNAFATQHGLSLIQKATPERETQWAARCKEKDFDLARILQVAEHSDYLTGKVPGKHGLDFDWMIRNGNNYVKILEGRYNKRTAHAAPGRASQQYGGPTRRTEYVPDIETVHSTIFGGDNSTDPSHT